MNRAEQKAEGSYVSPSFEHAMVRDAMRPEVLTCPPEARLREVARTMASEHVHSVIVTDRDAAGHEWAIVSDLDLMRAAREDIDQRTASWAAGSQFPSVAPDDPLEQALQLMLEHGVTHLVVVDPELDRPVGVLSTLDVAGVLAWGRA